MNKNYELRDRILFGSYDPKKYSGGIRHFECNREVLQKLVDKGFADPEETQNDSPSIREFLNYTEDYENPLSFECYAVSPERDDYRITVEGIDMEINAENMDYVSYFVEAFRWADEFRLDPNFDKYSLHAWWD